MASNQSQTVRQPEIDGLRGVAAVWVMCDHFGISALFGMQYGFLAVRLMLILSAYFAAKQLRLLWAQAALPTLEVINSKLVHYYTSRVVRLGMVAYVTIFLAVALNMDGTRSTWSWHAAFMTNEWIAHNHDWPGPLSHFWTLAVQMQFLLALPIVLLLCRGGGLWPMLILGMGVALGHRACVVLGSAGDFLRWMPISNSLDAFCLGVALAWVEQKRPHWLRLTNGRWLLGIAIFCFFGARWLRGHSYDSLPGILTETAESLWLVLLLASFVGGRTFGFAGALLRSAPMSKIGAASLSLYALHPIVEQTLSRICLRGGLGLVFVTSHYFQALAVASSLGVAWAGYRILEVRARKIVEKVEPVLRRWCSAVVIERELVLAWWQFRPFAAILLVMAVSYSVTSPLRMASGPVDDDLREQPIVEGGSWDGNWDLPAAIPQPEPEPIFIDDPSDVEFVSRRYRMVPQDRRNGRAAKAAVL